MTTTTPPAGTTITAMLDTAVYLDKLALFGRILRQEGMFVSPAETEDAVSILLDLGFCERETVKAALRTVYAKSREQQLRFDRVFDSFFLSEDAIRAIDKKHREQELERAKARQQAEQELPRVDPAYSYDDAQREAFAMLSEEEKERLRRLRDKYLGDDSRNQKLYAGMVHSIISRSIMEQQMLLEDAAVGRAAVDPELGLLFRDITLFEDREIPKAVTYIQDIARRINGELTQRRKRSGHSAALDFRATIRKGLETGGSFYRLAYRKKRARRRQLVVLCDVSGSMIQFSEFVLRFIQSLNQAGGASRVFLFSEELHEADAFHLQNMDLFRDYVRRSGVYGRGTDLGRALKTINDMRPPALSPATMLLVISDTKTVNQALAAQELLRARGKAGKVFWLNPLPERKWKYIGSVQTMSELCTMISCSTLQELGAACRRLALM